MHPLASGAINGLTWVMSVNPSSSDDGPSLREIVRDILEDLFAEFFYSYLVEAIFDGVAALIGAVVGFLSAVAGAVRTAVTSALSPLVAAGVWFAEGLTATQASIAGVLQGLGLAAPFAVAAGWAATLIFIIVVLNFAYALLSTVPVVSTLFVAGRSGIAQIVVIARSLAASITPGGNDD